MKTTMKKPGPKTGEWNSSFPVLITEQSRRLNSILNIRNKLTAGLFALLLFFVTGCLSSKSIGNLDAQHRELKKEIKAIHADAERLQKLQETVVRLTEQIGEKLSLDRQNKRFLNIQNNIADVKYNQEELASELAVIKENLKDNRQVDSKILLKLDQLENKLLKEIRKLKFKQWSLTTSKTGNKVGQ